MNRELFRAVWLWAGVGQPGFKLRRAICLAIGLLTLCPLFTDEIELGLEALISGTSNYSLAAVTAVITSIAVASAMAGLLIVLIVRRLISSPRQMRTWHTICGHSSEALIQGLAGAAGVMAGRRHGHLSEAWAADLFGDPRTGELPSGRRRLRLATGFVAAALRCRLHDLSVVAWHPVDALLESWRGSRLAMTIPVTVAAGLVLVHEGFYGLVTNAENLGVIASAPYLAIKGLRKYRQIETPKRAEKKAASVAGAGEPGK